MGKYYIAYGSNMDLDQMEYRCPNAELIGTGMVEGYGLLFKGSRTGAYATIEPEEGGRVPVLVWQLGCGDEENLDRYEGYPTFYYKKDIKVMVDGRPLTGMVYIMDERRASGRPSDNYYGVVEKAYYKFGFDKAILKSAFDKSTRIGGNYHAWNTTGSFRGN